MADEQRGTDDAVLAAAARHALHDEVLVAASAAGGLESDDETAQARSLVERCTVCRDLYRDIVAIGTALAAEATFAEAAPRDFRLTVDDAQRLGGHVRPRGFVASLRRVVLGFARPVGATLATFGLVGVLVGTASFGGGAASAPLAAPSTDDATRASAELTGGGSPLGGPKASDGFVFGPLASSAAASGGTGVTDVDPPSERDTASSGWSPVAWLLGGSVAMLLAGAFLLIVSFRRGRSRAASI